MLNIKKCLIPLFFLLFGLFIVFFPMFFDFNKMIGDLGDARFINYILEHAFLFLKGEHSSFLTPPFFYPCKDTLFYSDILLGGMLLYVPLRFLNFSPQTSLQVFDILCFILNFLTFFLVSKKIFKFDIKISSISAFLFAFSLPRIQQLGHIQLSLQFYSMLAFYFFFKEKKTILSFILSAIFLSIQFYTTFYYGWFFVFGAVLSLVIMTIFKDTREKVFNFMKENKNGLVAFILISALFLIPLAIKYQSVSSGFNYTDIYLFTYLSPFASLSFIDNKILNYDLSELNPEQITGLGIFTTAAIFTGFLTLKNYKKQVFLFIFFVILFFTFWRLNYFIYLFFIGAKAIRAGGRAIFLLLPLYSFLIGFCFKNLNKKHFVIFLVLIMAEQIPFQLYFDWTKEEHNKRLEQYKIPNSCEIFGMSDNAPVNSIDMMYVSNKLKKPTVNGYSGYLPKPKIELLKNECLIKPVDL